MSKIAPCKDCENRYVGCHSTCELYKEWKTEQENMKEKVLKRKKLNTDYVDYVLDQRSRIVRPKTASRNKRIVAQI